MNHSKYGLNEPFYKWIDEVRRAFRKEKELLEKLEYYNVKFMGYKGVNYGGLPGGGRSKGDEDMLYWLDKIDELSKQLQVCSSKINESAKLGELCNHTEKIVLNSLIKHPIFETDFLFEDKIDRNKYRQTINVLYRKWAEMLKKR